MANDYFKGGFDLLYADLAKETAGSKVGEASLFVAAVNELRAKKKQKIKIDMCVPECLIVRERVVAFVVYGDPHSGCFHSHHDAEILLEGCPFRPESLRLVRTPL